MSGGHFDYWQYHIGEIANKIEEAIESNNKEDEYGFAYRFTDRTIQHFKDGVEALKKAQIYAHRIDWLLSGDDGEAEFEDRLKKELKEIK